MQITSVVNQTTQRIIRGSSLSVSDPILYSPIQVIRIGLRADTSDYVPTDYSIVSSSITWLPSGNHPSPGQAYYITYKYNPTQFLKDFDTIVKELRADFNTLIPNLDVDKSVARDLYVNVQGRQYTDEYNAIGHVSEIQSLQNITNILEAELDAYGVNFSKARLPSTKASGTAKFYLNIASGLPITILSGSHIATMPSKTNNQQISFVTTADATILAGQLYVLAPIEAEVAGVSGNVGTDTITLPIDSLNVNGVTNIVATTGGQDQESNEDYARRLINVFKARNVGTVTGIRELALAQPNVIDCYVADVGDPVMVRDGGLGGKVDIYVQSESGFSGIILNEQFVYSGSDYTLLKQPAISITSVLNVTTATDITNNCTLIKDTGTLKESTRGLDKLHVISSATPTDVLQVTYVYNKLLNDIQELMDSDDIHIAGIDDLVRSALETFIDVTGSIKIASGYVFGDVQTSIIDQITAYIEAKEIGSSIVYGDIINIIHDTPGVADLNPLTRLSRSTQFTNVTVKLLGTEYPRAGNIVITQFA